VSRTVPGALGTHLAKGSSRLAFAASIVRKDGAALRIAETDADVTVDGQTYKALPGLTLGTIPYGLDGFSSGVDLEFGTKDDEPLTHIITRADIRDGMYDAAELTVVEFDQGLPAHGGVTIFWGRVSTITRTVEGRIKVVAKGILDQSHQVIVERYHPMCIWFFCDSRRVSCTSA